MLNVPQADERNRVTDRKEVPLFNQKVYREAVVNAFVHNHWLDGPPAFTVFQDRIEILTRGLLPPKQTMDGFFAGESVPVNEKLAKIILQLHISEQTGRGIPTIVSAYGKDSIYFSKNNIKITIPFNHLENRINLFSKNDNILFSHIMDSDGKNLVMLKDGNTPVGDKNTQVKDKNTPVGDKNTPVGEENTPVGDKNTPVGDKNTPVGDKNTPVRDKNTPVGEENTPVGEENTPVRAENTPVKLSNKEAVNMILSFCSVPRSILEIAGYLGYKEKKSVRKYIHLLLEQGRLAMTIPDKPHSRLQKYIAIQ